MTPTYPSPNPRHRRADLVVHLVGLALIILATALLLGNGTTTLRPALCAALAVYVLAALASNLASCAYHFSPLHARRVLLRRIDHAAIYPSISGSFTPFFVDAATPWTLTLLGLCWGLTVLAIWNKITNETIKSRWSTASYLGLGAIGLSAVPDLDNVPIATLWWILAGAGCYVIGTAFYTRKTMPYRYAIWHSFVNLGGLAMFVGIWLTVF